jgi:hypothetical protein
LILIYWLLWYICMSRFCLLEHPVAIPLCESRTDLRISSQVVHTISNLCHRTFHSWAPP